MPEDVWSAEDTSPAAIEAALRDLLVKRHAANGAYVPARVLNLVVIVDRDWRGEIRNRLDRVGRYTASRTVLCSVEPGRTKIDARATMAYDADPGPGELGVAREHVEIDLGPEQLEHLDTVVDPVLVPELITIVWSPHGHPEAVDALLGLAHVVLADSVGEPDLQASLDRIGALGERAYVVDLAWLRSTPWRERVAATFDPAALRAALGHVSAVTVRHHPESAAAALLFVGWLSSRLGWRESALVAGNGGFQGSCRGHRQEVAIKLDTAPALNVPGLDGMTIETASGLSISLDRGPGGLTAVRRERDGREWRWTVLGASRGEGGILGEGVRQALLRDPTYRPALAAARNLLG